LEHDGDPNWLKGLTHVPRKLRNLYEINKILAHRPWLITKEDIKVRFNIHFQTKYECFKTILCIEKSIVSIDNLNEG